MGAGIRAARRCRAPDTAAIERRPGPFGASPRTSASSSRARTGRLRAEQALSRVARDDVVDVVEVGAEALIPTGFQTGRAQVVEHASVGEDHSSRAASPVALQHPGSIEGRERWGERGRRRNRGGEIDLVARDRSELQVPLSRLPKRNADPVRRSQALITTPTSSRRGPWIGISPRTRFASASRSASVRFTDRGPRRLAAASVDANVCGARTLSNPRRTMSQNRPRRSSSHTRVSKLS